MFKKWRSMTSIFTFCSREVNMSYIFTFCNIKWGIILWIFLCMIRNIQNDTLVNYIAPYRWNESIVFILTSISHLKVTSCKVYIYYDPKYESGNLKPLKWYAAQLCFIGKMLKRRSYWPPLYKPWWSLASSRLYLIPGRNIYKIIPYLIFENVKM